jgi:hypothetical protein
MSALVKVAVEADVRTVVMVEFSYIEVVVVVEVQMPIKTGPKIVDVSEVPELNPNLRGPKRPPTPRKVWIERLLSIPPGKAMVYEDQNRSDYARFGEVVRAYTKKGYIPSGYTVTRKKTGENRYTIYVVHSAKEKEARA